MIGELLIYSKLQDRHLSIFLTDNKGIRKLNKQFFSKDKPTNVISFSYIDNKNPLTPDDIIGDIIVSVEMAINEGIRTGSSSLERLIELIVHGFVHILGFDHEKDRKEAIRMRYQERKFLNFLYEQNAYKKFISVDGASKTFE